MQELFIRGLSVDWSRVAPDAWLRSVPALTGLESLEFRLPAFLSLPQHPLTSSPFFLLYNSTSLPFLLLGFSLNLTKSRHFSCDETLLMV